MYSSNPQYFPFTLTSGVSVNIIFLVTFYVEHLGCIIIARAIFQPFWNQNA